jgi:3-hydroxybutyryl-CoA dehydratase
MIHLDIFAEKKESTKPKKIFLEDLTPGKTFRQSFTATIEDIELFAKVSHDYNPIHMSDEAAKAKNLEGRVLHAAYWLGIISGYFGHGFLADGVIFRELENTKLKAYTYPNQEYILEVVFKETIERTKKSIFEICLIKGSKKYITGTMSVFVPSKNS